MTTYKILGYLGNKKDSYNSFGEALLALGETVNALNEVGYTLPVSRVCYKIYFRYPGYHKYAGTIYIKKIES